MTDVRKSFIYPEINSTHREKYTFGLQNAGDILREDGDWRDFTPPTELQNINGIESASCYAQGSQHGISSILEEKFGVNGQDYSARFTVLLSGGTPSGGDPLKAADSIRNDGLIPETMMPFDGSITSWNEFASWKGANEQLCRAAGRVFKTNWEANNYIVFEKDELITAKYFKLKEALKRSPCPISIYGQVDAGGQYVDKPAGASDTHLVLALYVDDQYRITIFDTYFPFTKVLQPYYNSDFGMRWTVQKKVIQPRVTFGQMVADLWRKLFNKDYRTFGALRSPKWSEVRNLWIKSNPLCAVCSTKSNCEVHHVRPFHLHPELELSMDNFITLCRPHHYLFGHFMNWSSVNKDVREDATQWNARILNRPNK